MTNTRIGDGTWFDDTKWSLEHVPTTGEDAELNGYTVEVPEYSTITCDSIRNNNGGVLAPQGNVTINADIYCASLILQVQNSTITIYGTVYSATLNDAPAISVLGGSIEIAHLQIMGSSAIGVLLQYGTLRCNEIVAQSGGRAIIASGGTAVVDGAITWHSSHICIDASGQAQINLTSANLITSAGTILSLSNNANAIIDITTCGDTLNVTLVRLTDSAKISGTIDATLFGTTTTLIESTGATEITLDGIVIVSNHHVYYPINLTSCSSFTFTGTIMVESNADVGAIDASYAQSGELTIDGSVFVGNDIYYGAIILGAMSATFYGIFSVESNSIGIYAYQNTTIEFRCRLHHHISGIIVTSTTNSAILSIIPPQTTATCSLGCTNNVVYYETPDYPSANDIRKGVTARFGNIIGTMSAARTQNTCMYIGT